jgi:hypothetical protein
VVNHISIANCDRPAALSSAAQSVQGDNAAQLPPTFSGSKGGGHCFQEPQQAHLERPWHVGQPSCSTASATFFSCSVAMLAPAWGDPTGCRPGMRDTWPTPMAAARLVQECRARSLAQSIAGKTREAEAAGGLTLCSAPPRQRAAAPGHAGEQLTAHKYNAGAMVLKNGMVLNGHGSNEAAAHPSWRQWGKPCSEGPVRLQRSACRSLWVGVNWLLGNHGWLLAA